ncbi:MAG: class I SAM-dependent methyltransferase [Bdellovibrionales bacterium]|nr:class I SAM-dependent methyltransferase [Bdellovibrionales bacterium]
MKSLSIKARLFLRLLKNTKGGTVRVVFPDGTQDIFGAGLPEVSVEARDWQVFDEMVDKGDLGLAETIISGRLVVSDVSQLVQWACRNDQDLARFIHGTWYGTLADRFRRVLTRNSRDGAKRNIMAHYDLGNEFYKLWLDPTMTYSSALYTEADQDLTVAQLQKYDRIIDQLGINAGDHILEIGCGWGGFFSRAVERTGCKVTAVMNSPAQAKHNREMIARKGLEGQVELRQQDYRDIEGRFDKIVSIEMIEAVGETYWKTFFDKVSASLKSGGQAMIQSITIQDSLFDNYREKTDFIQRYIFPGGMLLAPKVFNSYGGNSGLKVAAPFEFGLSYAETLNRWLQSFNDKEQDVRALGFDDHFMRLWRLYLSYCEGAFRAGRINVGHYHLQK